MKSKFIILIFIFLFAISANSYASIFTSGNGVVKKYSREEVGFTNIVSKCNANFILEQSENDAIEIEIDENLIDSVIVRINKKTLVFEQKNSFRASKFNIRIKAKDINKIAINGSSDLEMVNTMKTKYFELYIDGAGDVKLNVESPRVKFEVNGAGDISGVGKTSYAEIEVNGAGDMDISKFVAESADVVVNGAGDIDITCLEKLTATVNGVGTIVYGGDTKQVVTEINGVGYIKEKNTK